MNINSVRAAAAQIALAAGLLHAQATVLAAEPAEKAHLCDRFKAEPDYASRVRSGLEFLQKTPIYPAVIEAASFRDLWQVWTSTEQENFKRLPEADKEAAIRRHYGLLDAPRDWGDNGGAPMGLVADPNGSGKWGFSCVYCHAQSVPGYGTRIGGNNAMAQYEMFPEDIIKLTTGGKRPPWQFPRGFYSDGPGVSHAWGVAAAFLSKRNPGDLKPLHEGRRSFQVMPEDGEYDLAAGRWWRVAQQESLYSPGLVSLSGGDAAIGSLTFMALAPGTPAESVKNWVKRDFPNVLAYICSLEPPKYPWPVVKERWARGKSLYEGKCARCHGQFPIARLENRIMDVGTDGRHGSGFSRGFNRAWADGLLGKSGRGEKKEPRASGYRVPALNGAWAQNQFLHNGSVPTLDDLLKDPKDRPARWMPTGGYDREKVGAAYVTEIPAGTDPRRIVDTSLRGKGRDGHRFGADLDAAARADLMEYLKDPG